MTSLPTFLKAPATISRHRPDADDRAFDRLRDEGLHWLQAIGGARWTDHNLHDPGITLLEQLCFALTDLEYRAGFAVADHLTGPDGRIDHEALSLHPPSEVFPCRATTADDYRRVLLDAVAGLDDATLESSLPEGKPAGAHGAYLPGLHHLTLKLSPGSAALHRRRIAEARAAYRRERNLCEDLDDSVTCVRDVPVELVGDIELAGPREAVEVLAEVYDRCARFIARVPRSMGLDEALRAGQTLEQVHTGPRVRHGLLVQADGGPPELNQLFLADLSALVRGIEGVAQVRLEGLRLVSSAASDAAGASSLAWRGPGWALRLRTPLDEPETDGNADDSDDSGDDTASDNHDHGAPADDEPRRGDRAAQAGRGHLTLSRRGHHVPIDRHALRLRQADLQASELAHRSAAGNDANARVRALLPTGTHRRASAYRSVQHDFPACYGLGRHGLSSSAPVQDRAKVQQFKAYLRLFDQVIANGQAQVDHLSQLFSINGGSVQSYWQQAVDADDVQGRDELLLAPAEAVLQAAHAPFDRATDRKSRALDHLLALHGVTYRQDSMRQFGSHLDAEELDSWLLDNKAAYLRDIISLSRDRAAGHDPSRSSWSDPANCAGLLRRACLLLGFRLSHDRPLTQVIRRQHMGVRGPHDSADVPDLDAARIAGARRIGRAAVPATPQQMQDDLRRITALRDGPVAPAWLRAGVRRDRYALAPAAPSRPYDSAFDRLGDADDARPSTIELLLGPDDNERWWPLGQFDDAEQATRAADSLQRFLRRINDDSEGMHIVEHLLLRPAGTAAAAPKAAAPQGTNADPGPEFYALCLSVVLPAWTLRTHDPAFRRFAEETLRINCPAHLTLHIRWLAFDAMQRFEEDLGAWMDAKAAHLRALDQHATAQRAPASALDAAARRVIAHLRPAPAAEAPTAPPQANGARHHA